MTIFNKSTIIVAHPDDEILWFSSVLDKVEQVIFCYHVSDFKPQWTIGRAKALSEHPKNNIVNLQLHESRVYDDKNFKNPCTTEYGIQIHHKKRNEKRRYIKNYHKLSKALQRRLIGCENVFTHNPWGEYGNEEHIQVFRAVEKLQKNMSFNLWFSNYVSNKSFSIMQSYISKITLEFVTLRTSKFLSKSIKNLYVNNACWTWYDDWEWPAEETFIKYETMENNHNNYVRSLPLNFINIKCQQGCDEERPKALRRFIRKTKLQKLFHSLVKRRYAFRR